MTHKSFTNPSLWLLGVVLALLFTTFGCKKVDLPTIITTGAGEVNATTAISGGYITGDGGDEVTARGVCWSTSSNPTLSNSHTNDGNGIGRFTSAITGLDLNTTYYIRAYATNSAGTGYGNEHSFTSQDGILGTPTVTIVNITATLATIKGTIPSDGGDSITSRGICWSTNPNPTLADNHTTNGSGTGIFTTTIMGLTPITTYYARAYATNGYGTGYSDELTFTTTSGLMSIITSYISFLDATSILGRGSVTADGGEPITERGVCWGTSPNPTITDSHAAGGEGLGSFSAAMTGFLPETVYYVRAYATNVLGITYGSDVTFTSYGSVTDIDGNVYPVATIGSQKWMAENLKTTLYRNWEPLSYPGEDNEAWSTNFTGAYAWNNNDISFKVTHGAFYNWYSVSTGRLCPTGWHVPSDEDWATLVDFVGGDIIAASKLKATSGWISVGSGTDNYGFSAIPGGNRSSSGTFRYFGQSGYWWSSTDDFSSNALYRSMYYNSNTFYSYSGGKGNGLSVRCLKD